MKFYMHTIEGKPAYFEKDTITDCSQICYTDKVITRKMLVKDLRTIKRHQEISKRNRAKYKWDGFSYGYRIIKI